MIQEQLGRIPLSPNLAATLGRASDHARRQSHAEVSVEHMVLALAEDPDAAQMLNACRVDAARVRAEVSAYLARSKSPRRSSDGNGEPTIAEELRRILEAASKAAQEARRTHVNGAIVLAAIVGDGQSAGAQILQAQGLTFEEAVRALRYAAGPAMPRGTAPTTTDDILASARARVQSRFGSPPGVGRSDVPVAKPANDAPSELRAAVPQSPPAHSAEPEPPPRHGPEGDGAEPAGSTEPRTAEASSATETHGQSPPSPPPFGLPEEPARAETKTGRHPEPESEPHGTSSPRPEALDFPARARSAVGGQAEPALPGSWAPPAHPAERPPVGLEPQVPQAGPPPLPRRNPVPLQGPVSHPPVERGGPRPVPPPQMPPAALRPPPPRAPRGGPLPPGAPRPDAARPPARRRVAPPARRSAAEPGQLVENIPRRMRVGVPAPVEARIARMDVQFLAEGLQGGGAVYPHEVAVTRAMTVRLRAPQGGFTIETASPETQWIESSFGLMTDDFASWRWTITPTARGRRPLQLVISARTVGTDGLTAETALPDQVIQVRVRVNYARSLSRLGGWIAAAACGGLLARFGEGAFDAGYRFVSVLFAGTG